MPENGAGLLRTIHDARMTFSIVTGANKGIGLALVAELKNRGHHVLAACRTSSPELARLGAEVVEGVDVASDRGIAALVAAVGTRSIDLLVNNAGILIWGDSLGELDVEGIRKQFEVNALAPLRVTDALRQRLAPGAKVALITSRMGSIDDNSSGAAYGYRMSKAALNMAGKSLAVDLRPRGVAVAILHPGMVKTDMTGAHGQVEPGDAARDLVARIDELTLESSGGFWHAKGQRLPW
jgi:NAD(P)-dependent dehydrogenase (short-subunit alcohol dehydrogenase family)